MVFWVSEKMSGRFSWMKITVEMSGREKVGYAVRKVPNSVAEANTACDDFPESSQTVRTAS